MISGLSWLGKHARWVLVFGSVLILFLPSSGGALRVIFPWLVTVLLSLTMARIDLRQMVLGWGNARHFLRLLALVLLLMPVTGLMLFGFSRLVGLPDGDVLILLVFAMAAPIGSAAGMCFMLGWNAQRALEATLLATFAMPFLGPLVIGQLLPGAVSLDTLALLTRLAAMVGGATLLSLVLRRVLTPEWIEAESFAFDGATALVLLAFLLPVFDGIGALLIAEPVAWLRMLGFVLVLNFGASCVTILLARLRMNSPDAGALGIMWGNRNVGIYFAALPLAGQDLQLFIALYQFPMYFTPLVLGWLFRR